MTEHDLRALLNQVMHGRLPRRAFLQRMLALGLTAPMASAMLSHAGIAQTPSPFTYKPTKRGGGGALKLLWWQAPTHLNPHFGLGVKDLDAARIFYEPLAAWDNDGNLVPILSKDIPSRDNGGLAADGRSVTWRLKSGVLWHDGRPFTADDVVFNWEFAADPASAAVTSGTYRDIKVVKVDDLTVRIEYARPTPFWADPFVSARGMIIPKHHFQEYKGAKSRDAPANLKPVGTGPYQFVDFAPGDLVRAKLNPNYHVENRPHFDTLEMKGGGDAISAARAVIQTGEYDFAWNMLVEDDVLQRLEKGGKGRVFMTRGGNIEHIQVNHSDPWTEVDGERSSLKSKHPILSDAAVRQALGFLIDRIGIQDNIFGRAGEATTSFINHPDRFRSRNIKHEFDIQKASALLEAAGWKPAPDGIRVKDGKRLKLLFATSINAPRQKAQAIIKQACQKAGIDIELKGITASVFFSSDVANPDTLSKFNADLQMYSLLMGQPDPERLMLSFCSWEVASKDNKWQGRNVTRWRNGEYDQAYRAAESELDPVKRAALFIKMNDLACRDHAVIPLNSRLKVSAISNKLHAPESGWDSDLWKLADWYRDA